MMGEIWDKKGVETAQTPDRAVPKYDGEVQGHARLPPLVYDNSVNHPAHYTDGGIETIDFIEAKKLNYNRGNAVKYITRAGKKSTATDLEDLKKAIWYLEREIRNLRS